MHIRQQILEPLPPYSVSAISAPLYENTDDSIRIYSGDDARKVLTDQDLERAITSLIDHTWDPPYDAILKGTNTRLIKRYPEILHPEAAARINIIADRVRTSVASKLVPWTWQHAFDGTFEEAKTLRDEGQYSVALCDGLVAGSAAYKHEGKLPDGTDVYALTKASVFEEFAGRGIYSLVRERVYRQMQKNCGSHKIFALSKREEVLGHFRKLQNSTAISLDEHQDLRTRGGHVRYPECIVELCQANDWEVWLAENPYAARSSDIS